LIVYDDNISGMANSSLLISRLAQMTRAAVRKRYNVCMFENTRVAGLHQLCDLTLDTTFS
jgi:hypothetical protein